MDIDDAVTLGELITSICEWGIAHEEQIRALEAEEGRRLARMFGLMIGDLVGKAEAEERVLLADLLEDVEL